MDPNGLHALIALSKVDEKTIKELVHELKAAGVPIESYDVKYRKVMVHEYLNSHPQTDILLVSEMLEWNNGFTINDYERMVENHENLCIMPILVETQKGKPYLKELFNLGIFNALFNEDADINTVASIMLRNRTRKEAKHYYNLRVIDDEDDGADIHACVNSIRNAEDIVKATLHVLRRVTPAEFKLVSAQLPQEIRQELRCCGEPTLQSYFEEDKKVKEKKFTGLFKKIPFFKDSLDNQIQSQEKVDSVEEQEQPKQPKVNNNSRHNYKDVEIPEIVSPAEVEEAMRIQMLKQKESDRSAVEEHVELEKSVPVQEEKKCTEPISEEVQYAEEQEFTEVPVTNEATYSNIDLTKDVVGKDMYESSYIDNNLILELLIGVVGTKRGIGTTFQAIAIAKYFASKGKHVALIEEGNSRAFEAIEKTYSVRTVNDEIFEYQDIRFYKNVPNRQPIGSVYEVIVRDYGTYNKKIKDSCLSSLELFVVTGGMPWENTSLVPILDEIRNERANRVLVRGTHVLLRGTDELLKDMINYDYYKLPTIQNPFEDELCAAIKVILTPYIPYSEKETDLTVNTEQPKDCEVVRENRDIDDSTPLDEVKTVIADSNTKKDALRREKKIPKIHKEKNALKGICSVFVASIRPGCGCTHVSATLANHLLNRGTTCLISDEDDELDILSSNLDIETDFNQISTSFSTHNNIVIDGGVYSNLSDSKLAECRRSLIKIMVCWGGSSNLKKLASFVEREGDQADKWIYVFNNIPDSQIKDIKKLMNYYTCCFMPVYSLDDIPAEVAQICTAVLKD